MYVICRQNTHLTYISYPQGIYRLICDHNSHKRLNVGAGYHSLAYNIKKFHELRLMPEGINVCIENLDEGSGIAQSFVD